MILEEPPLSEDTASEASWSGPMVLSANTRDGLVRNARRYLDFVQTETHFDMASMARTTATDRAPLDERAALLAQDREGLTQALNALVVVATIRHSQRDGTMTVVLWLSFHGAGQSNSGHGPRPGAFNTCLFKWSWMEFASASILIWTEPIQVGFVCRF